MSYVVLARKWRPQTFADLTGQDHVTRTLTNAIEQDRVPHALLFTGARGVGKTTSARIVAMALNCADGPTPSPCGRCDSCREVPKGASVDVIEIDGASNRGINEIRELRDGVRYAPNRDRYKIHIIDEVHMLTTEAFNALLKTLEEPPPHVVFIFATTEAHKIPITILSRCQRFDFRRIPVKEIVGRLQYIVDAEKIVVPNDVLTLIARQSGGGMRDALSRLDQVIASSPDAITLDQAAEVLGVAERARLFEISAAIIGRDLDQALRVFDHVLSFGVDVTQFSSALVAHLRDLTIVAVSHQAGELTALTDTELAAARAQVAQTDPNTLHRLFEILMTAADDASRSSHARLLIEMALVRMIAVEPVASLVSLVAQLDRIASGEGPLRPAPGSAPTPPSAPTLPQPAAMPAAPAPVSAPRESHPVVADSNGRDEASAGPPTPGPVLGSELDEPANGLGPAPEVDRQALAAPDDGDAAAASVAALAIAATPGSSPRADIAVEVVPTKVADSEGDEQIALIPGLAPSRSAAFEPAQWRAAVEWLRERQPATAAILSSTVVRAGGPGEIIAEPPAFLKDGLSAAHREHLAESLAALGLPAWTIRVLDASETDDGEHQSGYQLTREVERERHEQRRADRARVESHPATSLIMGRWPGARLGEVERSETATEESVV